MSDVRETIEITTTGSGLAAIPGEDSDVADPTEDGVMMMMTMMISLMINLYEKRHEKDC